MKFLHTLILLLVTLLAYTSAQRCPGIRGGPTCRGPRNVGRGGRGCKVRTMWYYDAPSRQCREMRYLGCRGNRNRWCTRKSCERRCRRGRG